LHKGKLHPKNNVNQAEKKSLISCILYIYIYYISIRYITIRYSTILLLYYYSIITIIITITILLRYTLSIL